MLNFEPRLKLAYMQGYMAGQDNQDFLCPYDTESEPELVQYWVMGYNAAVIDWEIK